MTVSSPATRVMKRGLSKRSWVTKTVSSPPPNTSICLLSRGPKSLAAELRLDKLPLNVLIVDDIKPYKERKVAILNGAHTALVPVAYQAGLDTVGEAMNDPEICAFVEKAIYAEIIPVLDLPRAELESLPAR